MRLDKYLKVSRLIKRRTVAKDASNDEKVLVNGKIAKPSYDVKVGDIIEVRYFKSTIKVKVKELINSSKKEDALEMYELIEVTNTDNK